MNAAPCRTSGELEEHGRHNGTTWDIKAIYGSNSKQKMSTSTPIEHTRKELMELRCYNVN